MNNSTTTTWGDAVSLEYGKPLRDYREVIGSFPVFGSNGPIGWTQTPLVQGPGIILGRKGAYRGIHFSKEPFSVIDTAYHVVPKRSDLDIRWLYYAMQFSKLGDIDDGSPIPSTTRAAVYVRQFSFPPLAEQKRIAHILGTLDDKIELNRRMNATLESMARALFKSWFVDFDPVRTKQQGRQPANMDPATAARFPSEFEDSELGPIPKGWEVRRLGELAQLAYGKPLKAENRICGKYFVYGSNGVVGTHNESLVTGPGIIVGRKGNPGIVTWSDGDFFPIDTTFYVISIGSCQSLYFLYYALKNQNLCALGADSAVPGLNRNQAYGSNQVVPPLDILAAFDNLVVSLFKLIAANHAQSRMLAALRDAQLSKLLNFKVLTPGAYQSRETVA